MADYWIAFRINEQRRCGREANQRYQDLLSALEHLGTGFWYDETSVIAMRAEASIDHIGRRVKRAVDPRADWVVIREIGVDSTRYLGEPGRGFLAFFPRARRI